MKLTLPDLQMETPAEADFFLGASRTYELDYSKQHLRRFLEIAELVKGLPITDGDLLDVGTTPFTFLLQRQSGFRVSTIDYKEGFRTRCLSAGIVFEQHDLTEIALPFPAESFDVIVMTEVFEHIIADPVRILRKMWELLRPSGYLVFGTPNLASLQNRLLLLAGQPILDWPTWELPEDSLHGHGHNRIYCCRELRTFMERAGFKVERIEYSDCLDRSDQWDSWPVRLAKWSMLPAKFLIPSFRWGIHMVAAKAAGNPPRHRQAT